MKNKKMKIGIIGTGFVGRIVAELTVKAGHEVMISNSRKPEAITPLKSKLGCTVGTPEEAAIFGELIIIAIPFKNYKSLPSETLAGKIVVDANNYYPERDGSFPDLENDKTTSSEMVAAHLPNSTVIKALNAISASDLGKSPAITHESKRAIPIAGDSLFAKKKVAELIIQFNFDIVDAGNLADSWRFEPGRPAYFVPLDYSRLLETLYYTKRDNKTPHGSWREE